MKYLLIEFADTQDISAFPKGSTVGVAKDQTMVTGTVMATADVVTPPATPPAPPTGTFPATVTF